MYCSLQRLYAIHYFNKWTENFDKSHHNPQSHSPHSSTVPQFRSPAVAAVWVCGCVGVWVCGCVTVSDRSGERVSLTVTGWLQSMSTMCQVTRRLSVHPVHCALSAVPCPPFHVVKRSVSRACMIDTTNERTVTHARTKMSSLNQSINAIAHAYFHSAMISTQHPRQNRKVAAATQSRPVCAMKLEASSRRRKLSVEKMHNKNLEFLLPFFLVRLSSSRVGDDAVVAVDGVEVGDI